MPSFSECHRAWFGCADTSSSDKNDDGTIIDSIVLNPSEGNYGVNIGKNVWHTVEALESSVLFEVKEGPFVSHEEEVLMWA